MRHTPGGVTVAGRILLMSVAKTNHLGRKITIDLRFFSCFEREERQPEATLFLPLISDITVSPTTIII